MIEANRSDYALKPMTAEMADRVYPLIRGVAPGLALEEWRACAGAFAGGEPEVGRETAVLAMNSAGYVKGVCIYAIRSHAAYGRLLDVPVFVIASAADAERVGAALLAALQAARETSACSGVRFWTMGPQTWTRRLDEDDIGRTDHGVFLPAIASRAEAEAALAACMFASPVVIDRPYP